MNDKVEYWLEIAEYDFDTAKVMLDGKRYLYVGFMCHQVIEKSLKAVISGKGETPPKIHRLAKLAQLGGCYNKMDDEQKDFLDYLDPLNVAARYPQYKQEISAALNKTVCEDVLRKTGDLLCWIKQLL